MSDNKIIEGAKQALGFARGDCEHEWRPRSTHIDYVKDRIVLIKECRKCGVCVNNYVPRTTR
jgi:hypothetical protein